MEHKPMQTMLPTIASHGTFVALAVPKQKRSIFRTSFLLRGMVAVAGVALVVTILQPRQHMLATNEISNQAAMQSLNCLLDNADASPQCNFPTSAAQSWFAPPRNLHPSIRKDVPIPTNRWWGNLISSPREDYVPEKRVWTNPYAVVLLSQGVVVSFPYGARYFQGASGNAGGAKSYSHQYSKDVTIGAITATSHPFQVTSWDDLGVTLRQERAPDQWLQTSLVSGMAYVTAAYSKLPPRISTTNSIVSLNGKPLVKASKVVGDRFVLGLNNGQQWVVYASSPVTLSVVNDRILQQSNAFTGHIRVALVRTADDIAAHDKYHGCIVHGGNLTLNQFDYGFQWATSGSCSAGLLHFALAHHAAILTPDTATPIDSMSRLESATRGAMVPLVTVTTPAQWILAESLVPVELYPRQRPTRERIQSTRLLAHLKADIDAPWSMPVGGSYYFNGKLAQKYASLCLMASDRAVVGADDSLVRKCQTKLADVLKPFTTNTFAHRLVYDTVYKGIVTTQGFDEANTYADFGNTIYNDHHYHFGYWVAAAAITNMVHPTMPGLDELNTRVSFLIRDVANADATDADFPTFRMFDWFKGHSYSHGITAAEDGKDLESTSEDVNFYYAMALFGQATGQRELEHLGRLMLSVNVRSVQMYFLMDSANTIHPPSIRVNHVPGIYFDNKVHYTTWFSDERKSIHMIQMLPVTPVTEYVRTKQFVQEEWTDILAKLPVVQEDREHDAALSLLYLNYAAVHPDVAMSKLQTVALDDGLSRSWALYMAASRYT
ncbi:hypothetical protein H310_01949 [Aphanomyces invadans]|uniref:glucan endo-1,3-beta-D-glucosidase n=1 Tax=Aphanomyces invadans TaxID=157072 RepID=A0A024ULY4_9STRA|nr:hypothetical protein H310_01949 [Aphanomyces invadans]ETW07431.1 hypothetical protein H310_01949 [Aphanomyces invadans]|eukprot:XP_008863524.1 hypothetical protein H310_01949 [Aphanomyces invadans]